ncbi:MAG TPA: flagellar basal body rod C-terminal domain-containing protein [Gemmatimonadaceae bacterium]|nr:flagellar basal body rod C-terminal domain-containing protein [Gemmatimonadaceae bacterium]
MSTRPTGFLPLLAPMPRQGTAASLPRAMFRTLAVAGSGLSAQRFRLELTAQNIANAETTRTPEGGPYRRRVAELAPAGSPAYAPGVPPLPALVPEGGVGAPALPGATSAAAAVGMGGVYDAGTPAEPDPFPRGIVTRDGMVAFALPSVPPIGRDDAGGVDVTGVVEDAREGALVYDPGHPDADANGYVRMPNVNVTEEMVTLMEARRLYEANATVFQAGKQMLRRTLDI